ncbi:MAG: WD40/YVTN/BNR-like repeat-containing protein, partial [Longimicrobiales bacterium]
MRRVATALFLGLILVAPVPAMAQRTTAALPFDTLLYNGLRWRMIGPYRGGRATAVTGIAGQPHTFLVGTTGGGVWKSDDAGMNWRNITDGYFGGSIGAVAVAPSDANVIYVGTGSACIRGNVSTGRGAWRSTDAGKTWTFIGLPESGAIGAIVVHPQSPDIAYVAALGHPFGKNRERGLYRTKDGGKSWENVLFLNDSTGVVDVAMNPHNTRILFAGAWRAERKPWTLISGGAEGGVYRSTDGGDTWKKLEGGLPTGIVGRVAVTVSPANPDRVWAMIEAEPAGGVYRSDDGGNTWTRTNSENKLRQRAWYYTHIEADPKDENTVYGLNTSFFRSVDGGKTFDDIPVPHGDMHDVWINPDNPKIIAVADDGGAQVSLTGGKTFSTYYNQPTAELYGVAVDNQFPYRVYGAQQDNTGISLPIWSSSNAIYPKQDWQYPAGCETGPIAFHPDQPHIVWGGCYGGAINRMNLRTDERRNVIAYPQLQLGQAAKDLKYRFQWVAPIVVSPHDPNTVYHAAQKVLRTRDGGMTWEEISGDLTTATPAHLERSGGPINNDITGVEIFNTVFALVVSAQDANTIWAGTDDGRVHVTRDGGGSWCDVTPPGMPRFGTVNRIEASRHANGRAFLAVQRYRMDDWKPYI